MALGREDADGGGSYGFPAQLPNESDGNKVTPEGKNPAKIKLSGKRQTGANAFNISAAEA